MTPPKTQNMKKKFKKWWHFLTFAFFPPDIYIMCLIWEMVLTLSKGAQINLSMTISGTMWWYHGTPAISTLSRLTRKSQHKSLQEPGTWTLKVSTHSIRVTGTDPHELHSQQILCSGVCISIVCKDWPEFLFQHIINNITYKLLFFNMAETYVILIVQKMQTLRIHAWLKFKGKTCS